MNPLITWEDMAASPEWEIPFLINPYIPRGGIILLYGKTRVGKSPLTWESARCIGSGEPFFGLPTAPGRVLYLELDTPRLLVQPRVKKLPPAPNVWFQFMGPCNVSKLDSPMIPILKGFAEGVKPDLVVVNTLRGIYQGDEKDGVQPIKVYANLQYLFPNAAILLVHHDKKSSGNPDDASDPDEAFSGHMAWLNHCQVGLHIVKHGPTPGLIRLVHSKSQVSRPMKDFVLQLHKDGTNLAEFSSMRLKQILEVYQLLPTTTSKTERVRLTAVQVGLKERQVWTYLSRLPDASLPSEIELQPGD